MAHHTDTTAHSGRLYRNMIHIARRQDDEELERLLLERLHRSKPRRSATPDGCEIIELATAEGPAATITEIPPFWKDQTFWTDLIQFLAFFSASLAGFLHVLHLITLQFPIHSG
ncbi:MAG: hypothetical protein LJE65_07500 [Desulfobacteraceae bacterium]|jgi:hypothetical protein|nr:hypothetical protein [Desulfobacteraceae bacterium]